MLYCGSAPFSCGILYLFRATFNHFRLQEEPYSKNLKVRVVDQGELTVSFCRSQNRDEDNMLCELDVTLPPPSSDPDVSFCPPLLA